MQSTTADHPSQDHDAGDKIIHFPRGLPGFEDQHDFRLTHAATPQGMLYWLESREDSALSFTLVDPSSFGLNYAIELTADDRSALDCADPAALVTLLMLAKSWDRDSPDPPIHANIAGPILINPENRIGIQKVLVRSRVAVTIVEGG